MILRRSVMLLLWVVAATVVAEEHPPGLVSKDSEQDLVAEASQTGPKAQKREAGLSNSYGEPLPADAYGPPTDLHNIIPDLHHPAPVYGVPSFPSFQQTPPGAYGPPAPVNFPSQVYHGPPPPMSKPKPHYGPPKSYGPPKPIYGPPKIKGPPKPIYGPPKKTYGPPKQSLPKPTYGAPFKAHKISHSKPLSFHKHGFNSPKPVYGPPKVSYGAPIINVQGPPPPPPLPDLPQLSLPPIDTSIDLGLNLPAPSFNLPAPSFNLPAPSFNLQAQNLNLPAPIYGTPLLPPVTIPVDLKPNYPIPSDSYGPPGLPLGPVGPNEQIVVQNIGSIEHYGPPQPDPNPQPPHPGIPAPPTPPHVLYDGWKPIPGVSQQFGQISNQYGTPQVQEIQINLDQSPPSLDQHNQFSSSQITTGYSNVHQDVLANVDLNAIVGGDSNNIDQSKTVYEAHYTENHAPQGDLSVVQTFAAKPLDTYGAPSLDTFSGGSYTTTLRQQGAKGLIPPSGFYGVPPGSHYGAPPNVDPNLPLPYGHYSGGGHSGGHNPHKPIKFRESVPEGLLQNVAQTTKIKDHHAHDHFNQGPAYLPPPIREIKDINYQSLSSSHHGINRGNLELSNGNVGFHAGNGGLNSVSLSIEPTSLYSLPHAGNPITFQQPSSSYGSPIDSYAAPLLTVGVGDHVTSGSNTNSITSTIDGTVLANLSNLDAAAILKHCPYHEAILKAAQAGERIPIDLASNYIASLSSLGTTLNKSVNTVTIPESYAQDLATAHTVIRSVYPENQIKKEKAENYSLQKGKSLKNKQIIKDERLQFVSDQILKTSEKIRSLSEEAKQLQQKIVSSSQNVEEVPINGNGVSYSVQIQSSSDQKGKAGSPSIPHEQLLSEGLLQSILHAIEDPTKTKQQNIQHVNNYQQFAATQSSSNQASANQQYFQQQQLVNHQQFFNQPQVLNSQSQIAGDQGQSFNYQNQNFNFANGITDGLVLPVGYEPIDRTKTDLDVQDSHKDTKHISHDIVHNHSACDLRGEGSVKTEVVVPAPKVNNVKSSDIDDVAIFFDDKEAPVTEISVATSISEEDSKNEYGDKLKS